jgi:hypothetical protein
MQGPVKTIQVSENTNSGQHEKQKQRTAGATAEMTGNRLARNTACSVLAISASRRSIRRSSSCFEGSGTSG